MFEAFARASFALVLVLTDQKHRAIWNKSKKVERAYHSSFITSRDSPRTMGEQRNPLPANVGSGSNFKAMN
jgi:hypothetical protein